jgi:hypothetical protein
MKPATAPKTMPATSIKMLSFFMANSSSRGAR